MTDSERIDELTNEVKELCIIVDNLLIIALKKEGKRAIYNMRS